MHTVADVIDAAKEANARAATLDEKCFDWKREYEGARASLSESLAAQARLEEMVSDVRAEVAAARAEVVPAAVLASTLLHFTKQDRVRGSSGEAVRPSR